MSFLTRFISIAWIILLPTVLDWRILKLDVLHIIPFCIQQTWKMRKKNFQNLGIKRKKYITIIMTEFFLLIPWNLHGLKISKIFFEQGNSRMDSAILYHYFVIQSLKKNLAVGLVKKIVNVRWIKTGSWSAFFYYLK